MPFITSICFGGLQKGFEKGEAKDMIAICNSFTFLDLYNSDNAIIPKGYKKRYTSGVFGMDNKYQIFQKESVAVINFRGSTDKQLSWIENIYSAMIPAKGIIEVEGDKFEYCFAINDSAAVHSGYALGIGYLYKDLIYQINILNHEGIYDFLLTGHSQGGALCNLLRTYLENVPDSIISKLNTFKNYAFAAPMVGNKEFANEYSTRYCSDSSSFNIVNIEDLIPAMPISYNDSNYAGTNLKSLFFDRESFSIKKVLAEGGANLFQERISQLINRVGSSAAKKIGKELGTVQMPEYVKDINYHPICNRIELSPFEYPKILKDSSILMNDSLMNIYAKDENGNLTDEKFYRHGSWGYQHKPYNYYVTIMKLYFPLEYNLLKKKYLKENL